MTHFLLTDTDKTSGHHRRRFTAVGTALVSHQFRNKAVVMARLRAVRLKIQQLHASVCVCLSHSLCISSDRLNDNADDRLHRLYYEIECYVPMGLIGVWHFCTQR